MTHSCSQAPLLTVRAPWWIALPKLLIKGGQSSDVCLAAEGMRNYKRWLFLSKYPSMSMNFYWTNSCLMELERNYVVNYLEFNKYKKKQRQKAHVSRAIVSCIMYWIQASNLTLCQYYSNYSWNFIHILLHMKCHLLDAEALCWKEQTFKSFWHVSH